MGEVVIPSLQSSRLCATIKLVTLTTLYLKNAKPLSVVID
jgi:hypothetical protein